MTGACTSVVLVRKGSRSHRTLWCRMCHVRRFAEVFSKLRVLVMTVTLSFGALFWSMVLLSAVMLLAALFLCQALNATMLESGVDQATKSWIFRFYGTPSRAIWTVFELTFSGGWPSYARPMVEDVSAAYAVFFFIYISSVTFAMFRIITALFLKDTLGVASHDVELAIQEKMKEKHSYAAQLLEFFVAADTSGDGYLTIEEFENILKDEHVRSYLSYLELDHAQSRPLGTLIIRIPIIVVTSKVGETHVAACHASMSLECDLVPRARRGYEPCPCASCACPKAHALHVTISGASKFVAVVAVESGQAHSRSAFLAPPVLRSPRAESSALPCERLVRHGGVVCRPGRLESWREGS